MGWFQADQAKCEGCQIAYPNEVKGILLVGAEGSSQQVCLRARGSRATALGSSPAEEVRQTRAAC